jgi:hypothetical protein
MSYLKIIETEFDKENKILHLSAKETIVIKTQTELNTLCADVHSILGKHCSDSRGYMIVNLVAFSIEPMLAESYGKKIMNISEKFLFPGGLVRYGYQITRMTIRMSSDTKETGDPFLFHTRREAENHIFGIIEKQRKLSNFTPR